MLRQSNIAGAAVGLAVCLALLAGCMRRTPQRQFVARVGDAVLSEEALEDSLARAGDRRQALIDEWVNTEVLYQEALRRGLDDDLALKRTIEQTRKKIIASALLEEELYTEEAVSDDEIVAVYNAGGSNFRLREDVVNASFALFKDRDAANLFRSRLIRGFSWSTTTADAGRDSTLRPYLLTIVTRQYFTQNTLYPPELWKLARSLAAEEVSFVVRTAAGFFVLVVHNLKKQGDLPELAYVREEIADRILLERRKLRYEKLLARLRSDFRVEVRSPDTSTALHE